MHLHKRGQSLWNWGVEVYTAFLSATFSSNGPVCLFFPPRASLDFKAISLCLIAKGTYKLCAAFFLKQFSIKSALF